MIIHSRWEKDLHKFEWDICFLEEEKAISETTRSTPERLKSEIRTPKKSAESHTLFKYLKKFDPSNETIIESNECELIKELVLN